MDKNLSIQEIKLLAEFKTNNKNISEQEAIDILNSVLPDFGKLQSCNSWAVQSANPSAFGSNNLVSGIKECEQMPDSTVLIISSANSDMLRKQKNLRKSLCILLRLSRPARI